MNVLKGRYPEIVWEYFEEICNIPHGSGNTRLISDYIVSIARNNHLRYIQDEYNNVIVYMEACNNGIASPGDDTVIIQGHMDMVCEKEDSCDIDFSYEPLRLEIIDGMLSAQGTTLGGDDGIAVAYMLALMSSPDIPHPRLELVFTVDEEIGMLGAAAMDMSSLAGTKLLNIDSEEEGELLVSCAGGATVTLHFPFIRRGAQGDMYHIVISGLLGGHSGVEIDKGRANADILLGRALKELLYLDDSVRLVSLNGGLKDNAIPVRSEAYIISKRLDDLGEEIDNLISDIKSEYLLNDPDISIEISRVDDYKHDIFPLDESNNLSFLMAYDSLPNGVQRMSEDIAGLVQTSLNLGIMYTEAEEIVMSFSVRSSVEAEKKDLIKELEMVVRSAGGYMDISGDYPGWEYQRDSRLRDIMVDTYRDMYGSEMLVKAVHAGLECGLFVNAIDNLDAVSFGPDILDIHTPKERLDIDSAARTWDYLKAVLRKLCY